MSGWSGSTASRGITSGVKMYLQEARPRIAAELGYTPAELARLWYEKGAIVLTSNKAFSEWGSVFGDEVLATAILDRLLHHCDVIAINGPSYRLKNRLAAVEAPPSRPRPPDTGSPVSTGSGPHSDDDTYDIIDNALSDLAGRRGAWLGDPLTSMT